MISKKDFRKTLANNLKWFRLKNGYTQKNIADILKIDRSTYTYYESGKNRPGMETVNKLALLYRIDVSSFWQEQDMHCVYDNRRAKKRIKNDPLKVEELSRQERTLIALLRLQNNESAKSLIDEFLEKYG